ncbi:UDP-3-O-acyl-N-acetylglucosamine deacetylase [Parasaccharibacter sp. TMW2.1890]|uniref:UDP-3-O-acyl-N-acetylglucosamine deacetylase n=1 Tax=Parasaccharibacter sp. TMW2.1890 TaxID=2039289 RepID=UPI002012E9C8|nr:UDP-3-O-acyl-N-acetylglucosamine deacetylase [Parasaccharibacter sp. TMW2.1890]MCL1515141.1 UDP-3-O-[3-hydroxymyristoyl] N-acetylglucosamine deacetylase [Parasaccharibacter sp. TMW2.1890]
MPETTCCRPHQPPLQNTAHLQQAQTTLEQAVHCQGWGLHSGRPATVRLVPAAPETGIRLQRLDMADTPAFRLTHDCIISSPLATVAASPLTPGLTVATIEHLMAALHACEVDNLLIQLDGPELPILDGCSRRFMSLLEEAGRSGQAAPRRSIEVLRPVHVEGRHGAHASLLPAHQADTLDLSVDIDFPAPAIGQQSFQMVLSQETFAQEIAPCRTFVNHQDIDALQAQGLALGGSLDNALVIQHDRVLNPGGLRFDNECVRHKMLDTVGDLYCTGFRLSARFEGHRTGHALNSQLLHALFASTENWRFSDGSPPVMPSPG